MELVAAFSFDKGCLFGIGLGCLLFSLAAVQAQGAGQAAESQGLDSQHWTVKSQWQSDWRITWNPQAELKLAEPGLVDSLVSLVATSRPTGCRLQAVLSDRRPLSGQADPPILNGGLAWRSGQAGLEVAVGPLAASGLIQRITNPLAKAPPAADKRVSTSWGLQTTVYSQKPPLFYTSYDFKLASGSIKPGLAVTADGGSTVSLAFTSTSPWKLAVEALVHYQKLPERPATGWFTEPPPLPARDLWIGAVATTLKGASLQTAADLAVSVGHYYPLGFYGNGGLSWLTDRLQLSLAADSHSANFSDSSGKTRRSTARLLLTALAKLSPADSLKLELMTVFPPAVAISAWEAAAVWTGRRSANCRLEGRYQQSFDEIGLQQAAGLTGSVSYTVWTITGSHRLEIDSRQRTTSQTRFGINYKTKLTNSSWAATVKAERQLLISGPAYDLSGGATWDHDSFALGFDLSYRLSQAAVSASESGQWRLSWSLQCRQTGQFITRGIQ